MMSLMLNPIQEPSAKPAILLPQSNADDFTRQGRASGWERVNWASLSTAHLSSLTLSLLVWPKLPSLLLYCV